MISEDSIAALRRLMEARERRDLDKKAADKSEKEYRDIEADVYEQLEENPIKGALKLDLGEPWGVVSFSPRETYYARIIDQDALQEHYEQRAMIEEISAPKFVKARLNEEVREILDSGGEMPMPPGLDYYANRGVTITRQKS